MHSAMKLFCTLAVLSPPVLAIPAHPRDPCPYHKPSGARLVENSYAVKLKAGYTLDDHFAYIGKNLSAQDDFSYLDRIHFYNAILDDETLHDRVRLDPGVELVEHDQYIETPELTESQDSIELRNISASSNLQRRGLFGYVGTEQVDTTWWHSQITIGKKMDPIMDKGNAYNFKGAGLGVDIYVLDTGVWIGHSAFAGRATNFRGRETSQFTGGPAQDYDSHGTHVASIAAKVAPNANIINVKVQCKRVLKGGDPEPNCKATNNAVGDAIAAITNDHVAKKNSKKAIQDGWKGSVISFSAGVESSSEFGAAVKAAVANGIPLAAAAGNTNSDKVLAPCVYKNTMCVGATNRRYQKYLKSNFGKSVGIVAPGDFIEAASIDNADKYTAKSGTSQATPMVAGAMAIFIGQEGLNKDEKDVQAVYDLLTLNSIPNIVTGFDSNTKTNFLNTGIKNPKKGLSYPFNTPEQELKPRADGKKTSSQASAAATSTRGQALSSAKTTSTTSAGAKVSAGKGRSKTVVPATTKSTTSVDLPLGPGYVAEGTAAAANPSEPAFYKITWTAPEVFVTAASDIDDDIVLTDAGTATATPKPT